MSYQKLGIFLLLQVFFFIQCSTAGTSDNEKENGHKIKNSFIDTNSMSSANSTESSLKEQKNNSENNTAKKITATDESSPQQNFKQIKFGFNIGYLGDLQRKEVFTEPLEQIKKDGISYLRIYEPFTKNIVQKPGLATSLIKSLSQAGFHVLLDLSNYPDIPTIQYKRNDNSPEQNKMSKFTNRSAPVNLNAFQSYLSNFLDKLQNEDVLQSVSFEIGNEPDAKKYFWGQASDFIKVANSVKQTLAKYNKPIYCCGFTSKFANEGSAKSRDYYDFLNDNSFFNNVNLSFHFYQDAKYDITKVHLPRLNNSIITEFNVFSSQKESTVGRTAIANSAKIGSLLIRALVFAYKNNITTIYLFKLVDTPDKESTYGFFDKTGKPKPSYEYFKSVYDVVKDGYYIDNNDNYIKIIGKQNTILLALSNQIRIPNQKIISASSGNLNDRVLNADEWIISEN